MSIEDVLSRIQELVPAAAPVQPSAATAPTASTASTAVAAAPRAGFAAVLGEATRSADDPAAPYRGAIRAAADRYGVDESLLESVIAQESGFDPNATSAAGAQGLMQLMPSTAASLGVTDPYDPAQSIDAGARYLADGLRRYDEDASLALAAYNAGSGAVARYRGIPPYPETQNYVQQVLARAERLHSERSAT